MAAIAKLLKAGKVLLVVSLISIFLNYFGLKSWERYQNQKVLVTQSWERPDFLPMPSITVCPASEDTGDGFSNVSRDSRISATAEDKSILEYICGGLEAERLVECVEKNVLDLASIVTFEGYGPSPRIDNNTFKDFPLKEEHWKMNFDYTKGPCHIFQNNQTIGTIEKGLKIGLNETMKHLIFVHDPRYFIKSKNPDIPVNEDVLDPRGSYMIGGRRKQQLQISVMDIGCLMALAASNYPEANGLLWKSIKAELENLDVSHTGRANSQQPGAQQTNRH